MHILLSAEALQQADLKRGTLDNNTYKRASTRRYDLKATLSYSTGDVD